MAIMGEAPINRLPAGFLGLLDLKQMGKNPSHVADRVVPMLSMEHLFRAQGRTQSDSGLMAVGGAANITFNLTVPQTKLWLVECVQGILADTLAATEQMRFCPYIVGPDGIAIQWAGTQSPLLQTGDVGVAVADSFVGAAFPALPGSKFGLAVNRAVLVAARNVRMTITFLEVDY